MEIITILVWIPQKQAPSYGLDISNLFKLQERSTDEEAEKETEDRKFNRTAVPNIFGTRDRFRGRQFFHGPGWGDGFGMIQAHYIYCALYFYYYYTVIYNEIIVQLTIMQNQWEPWARFHSPLTDRVLIWACKQLIYYGLCAVKPLC